jgi:hypothetical protein
MKVTIKDRIFLKIFPATLVGGLRKNLATVYWTKFWYNIRIVITKCFQRNIFYTKYKQQILRNYLKFLPDLSRKCPAARKPP